MERFDDRLIADFVNAGAYYKHFPKNHLKTSLKNSGLSTFLNFKCDRPETPEVKISLVCTLAEAILGGMPKLSKSVVQLTP